MTQNRSILDRFFLFLKGLGMGAANKVPGVSGGIVSFVAGFYSEFIYSLSKINFKAMLLLLNGRFKKFYEYTNGSFMLYITAGMIFSYFSVSLLIDYFLTTAELYVWSLFFGMILGSIYYIGKGHSPWNKRNTSFALLGLVLGITISFLNPAKENDNLFFIFLCGMIGVSGMTLPGLSGSFLLILLGNYVLLMVDSVNALLKTVISIAHWDFSFIDDSQHIRYLQILTVFTLGSIIGLVLLSKLFYYELKKHQKETTSAIIGFITGSLGVVWPWKKTIYRIDELGNYLLDSNGEKIVYNYKRFLPDLSNFETYYALIFISIGLVLLIVLEKYGSKQKK